MEEILFDGWASLIRTLVIGVLAYVALVLFLRIAGKRTLAKMNAFDWVVTVALAIDARDEAVADEQALERERSELLERIQGALETPMVVLHLAGTARHRADLGRSSRVRSAHSSGRSSS